MGNRIIALVCFGVLSAIAPGQEGAASRPAPDAKLPVADQAKVFDDKDAIKVDVFHPNAPSSAATRPSTLDKGWRIAVGNRAFALSKPGIEKLQEHLRELGDRSPEKGAPGLSSRNLVILADAGAPYGYIQKILEAAAGAGVYRITIGTASEADGRRRALDSWLPKDLPESQLVVRDEIRMILSWNAESNRLERLLGQQPVPATPEGDRRLEALLRAELVKAGKAVPLIIDSGPRVPWNHVVDILNLASRLGIRHVEFGFGTEMPK